MRLIAVLEQFAHHNPTTSPDNMINYIKYNRVIRPIRSGLECSRAGKIFKSGIDRALKKISGMSGYISDSLVTEMKVFKSSTGNKNLIHFYNGDTNCKFYPYLKGKNMVIATYHQPPEYFYHFFQKCSHIERLDGAIVTSNVLKELIAKYVDKERVFFVPLAVDVEMFRPEGDGELGMNPHDTLGRVKDKKICLFVGNWLRDFETMREVTKILVTRRDIEFHVVTLPANKKYFDGLANVRFYSGLGFESYLKELHMADLLVVPMKSCTSNLAILEAMACGLPIVSTDVGGIRDYIDDSFAILNPKGDYKAVASSIADLLGDDKMRQKMSARAREHSKRFSWGMISNQLKDVYKYFGN